MRTTAHKHRSTCTYRYTTIHADGTYTHSRRIHANTNLPSQDTHIYDQTPHGESYKSPPPTDIAQTQRTHPPETDTYHPH